jgi:F-type H+-transporting ATPase subunit b
MSAASLLSTVAARAIVVRSEFGVDDDGYVTSHNPIFPPTTELLISLAATLVVFGLLYKFAWPAIAKGMKDRTSRIQGELDGAAERSRLFAEADTQAEALIADGRARLEDEVAEMEARAEADIAAAATRSSDDLRADIARYSADALERMVSTTLDDTVQQELIEGFIARVGASGGPGANGGSA